MLFITIYQLYRWGFFMFKKRHISIQTKLMTLFGLLAVILFINVGFLFYDSTSKTINSTKEAQLQTLAQETANKIERFIFERYADIQVVAQSPMLKAEQHNLKMKLDYLDSVRRAYKTYDFIIEANKYGQIEVYSGDISSDRHYEEWLNKALNGNTIISDFVFDNDSETYKLYFSAPIIDNKGNITGAVIERMSFDSIRDIILAIKPGKSGYAYLISSKGDTAYFSQTEQRHSDLQFNDISGINYSLLGDQKYISAFYKIDKYNTQGVDWYVVVEETVQEAFEVTYRLRNYTILVIFISIIVSFLLIILISRLITHPIKQLVRETRSIAEGETSKSINIEGGYEIGSLAQSFNKILENLKSMMGQVLEISGEAASLDEIKQYAEKVFDNIPSAVIIADSMRNITVFNSVATDITGVQQSQLLGENINKHIHACLTPLLELMSSSLSNNVIYLKHFMKIKNIQGNTISIIANTSIRKDNDGKSIGIILVFRSVDEIKKFEEGIIRTINLKSLGELSAGMAHEIRNPLTSIKGYAQYVRSELSENNELRHDITIIVNEVDRLNNIIDRFLTFARPRKPVYSAIDLNQVITKNLDLLEKEISSASIEVSIKLEEIPYIQIDEEQISQVLINTIINSVQSMTNGGNIIIESTLSLDRQTVEISIKDNGIGIPQEDCDKIFEPFYTTKNKGTGLGLAVCWRIVENHKGHIEVNSIKNEGTEFIISLPIKND